mmetsp:Transcript_41100/g.109653  ORF Transcript_41100/g.109653 Transcript_41100/m.109653 type:complete len:219 (-) Transcript_41100:1515-2171(-)
MGSRRSRPPQQLCLPERVVAGAKLATLSRAAPRYSADLRWPWPRQKLLLPPLDRAPAACLSADHLGRRWPCLRRSCHCLLHASPHPAARALALGSAPRALTTSGRWVLATRWIPALARAASTRSGHDCCCCFSARRCLCPRHELPRRSKDGCCPSALATVRAAPRQPCTGPVGLHRSESAHGTHWTPAARLTRRTASPSTSPWRRDRPPSPHWTRLRC